MRQPLPGTGRVDPDGALLPRFRGRSTSLRVFFWAAVPLVVPLLGSLEHPNAEAHEQFAQALRELERTTLQRVSDGLPPPMSDECTFISPCGCFQEKGSCLYRAGYSTTVIFGRIDDAGM